jgi:hypothetical protein
MNTWKKLSALLGAGALIVALSGVASAASVEPIFHDGNITIDGEGNSDAAACDADDAIFLNGGDAPDLSGTSANGVTVTVTYNEDKSFDFEAEGGLVTIAYVKGSSGYNEYNYGSPGVASDENLVAPEAGGSGGAAGVSHLVFCTEETTETTTTTTTTTTEQTETTTTTTTTTTTFTQDTAADTDAPSEPNTATIGTSSGTAAPADGTWMLVIALGVLLGSVVVLTPAKARNRR